MRKPVFPAVGYHPLESFFTNRLYHLLGNLPRFHFASSAPVFSHVAMCTNGVDRHLSLLSLCLMRLGGLCALFFRFPFNNFNLFFVKHKEGSETKHLNTSLKIFFPLSSVSLQEAREGDSN